MEFKEKNLVNMEISSNSLRNSKQFTNLSAYNNKKSKLQLSFGEKKFHHGSMVDLSPNSAAAKLQRFRSMQSLDHISTSLTRPQQTLHLSESLRSLIPLRRRTSTSPSKSAAATDDPATTTLPKKEKKSKEMSSSRVKKFQNHFLELPKDEKLINYFSCSLFRDSLLPGHLYITDNYFAFKTNFFGYVTKVVIPTSSVIKISKEKTAKIIPDAVGVVTAQERYVFASFISRESAFRLMCSVCPNLGKAVVLTTDFAKIEIFEEYSMGDDSSCSISDIEYLEQTKELPSVSNENQAQIPNENIDNAKSTKENPVQTLENPNFIKENPDNDSNLTEMRSSVGNSKFYISESLQPEIPLRTKKDKKAKRSKTNSMPAMVRYESNSDAIESSKLEDNLTNISHSDSMSAAFTQKATTTPITGPSTLTSSKSSASRSSVGHLNYSTEKYVIYLGVILTLILGFLSLFLLYRITDIETKTSGSGSTLEINWRSGKDENIIESNLEQITMIRRSLETLSMLIHDDSCSAFAASNTDDSD